MIVSVWQTSLRLLRGPVFGGALALAAVSTAGTALAQGAGSPEALQAARDLVSLTSGSVVSQLVGDMTKASWPSIEKSLRDKNPKLDAAATAELRKEYEKLQVMATLETMNDAVPVYARYFTARELRELVTFYKTPTGKKALVAMPRASVEIIGGMGPRLQQMSQNVNTKFNAILTQRGLAP
jgi:uncharacterized protein